MKEEIIAGLRNAIERGQSIDKAAQTFINAGYNSNEVREAVESFSGASYILFGGNKQLPSIPKQMPQPNLQKSESAGGIIASPSQNRLPEKKKGTGIWIVIVLAIVLVLLLGFLLASILFKEQILNFIKNF